MSAQPAPSTPAAAPHFRPTEPDTMEQTLINRIVEAALLAASQPMSVAQLGALFTVDQPAPDGSLQVALAELQAQCAGRGVELVEVASGWRYQVSRDVHPWVARLWSERQTRYTRATLETLALIAYRQPITRGEIEQIRGVATNSNIIKALEERDWIRVVGHRDVPGRPELLGTTKGFLDYFGLKTLDQLPPLSELKDFGALEPQLDFDAAPTAANAQAEAGDASDAERDAGAASTDGKGGSASADDAANVDNGSADSHTQAPESGAGAETVSTSTDEDAQQPVSPAHPTHDSKEHDIAADGEVRSDT